MGTAADLQGVSNFLYVAPDGTQKYPYRNARGEPDRTLLVKARGQIEYDIDIPEHVRKRILRRIGRIAAYLMTGRKAADGFLEYKAAGGSAGVETKPSGIVTAYAAAFGNEDDGDDILHPGASLLSIKDRFDPDPKKNLLRVLFGHSKDRVLGHPIHVGEDGEGVLTETQYNMKTFWGNEAFHLIEAGDLTTHSMGYLPGDGTPEQKGVTYDDQGRRHLHQIHLFEYGPLPFAMNDAARVVAVKAGLEPASPFVDLLEQANAATLTVLLETEALAARRDAGGKAILGKAHIEALEGYVEDAKQALGDLEVLIKGQMDGVRTPESEDPAITAIARSLQLRMQLARARARHSGVKEITLP